MRNRWEIRWKLKASHWYLLSPADHYLIGKMAKSPSSVLTGFSHLICKTHIILLEDMGERKQDPTQNIKRKRFYHETNEVEASGHLAFPSPSQDQGMCSHGHCFPTFTEVKYFNHSYDDNHFHFDFPSVILLPTSGGTGIVVALAGVHLVRVY